MEILQWWIVSLKFSGSLAAMLLIGSEKVIDKCKNGTDHCGEHGMDRTALRKAPERMKKDVFFLFFSFVCYTFERSIWC